MIRTNVLFNNKDECYRRYRILPTNEQRKKLEDQAYGTALVFHFATEVCDSKADKYRGKVLKHRCPKKYMYGTRNWLFPILKEEIKKQPNMKKCPSVSRDIVCSKAAFASKCRAKAMIIYDKEHKYNNDGTLRHLLHVRDLYYIDSIYCSMEFQIPTLYKEEIQRTDTMRLNHKTPKGRGAAIMIYDGHYRLYAPKFREGILIDAPDEGIHIPKDKFFYISHYGKDYYIEWYSVSTEIKWAEKIYSEAYKVEIIMTD